MSREVESGADRGPRGRLTSPDKAPPGGSYWRVFPPDELKADPPDAAGPAAAQCCAVESGRRCSRPAASFGLYASGAHLLCETHSRPTRAGLPCRFELRRVPVGAVNLTPALSATVRAGLLRIKAHYEAQIDKREATLERLRASLESCESSLEYDRAWLERAERELAALDEAAAEEEED